MYVCICSELTEDVIVDVIEQNPNIDPHEVHQTLDVCIACGQCLPIIYNMIQDQGEKESANKGNTI